MSVVVVGSALHPKQEIKRNNGKFVDSSYSIDLSYLSDRPLRVSPQVLGSVVSVVPLTPLLDTEHATERTIGDLILPLVLK